MNFTIYISTYPTGQYHYEIDITENYEGDKWHVVVYEKDTLLGFKYELPYEHYETVGLNNEKEIFDYLRKLREEE
tara:strand:- start:1166 stop:1390 length:225 start_codon:yes stop_codon:yes gene_type:complete